MKKIIRITAILLGVLMLFSACGSKNAEVTPVDYTWVMKAGDFTLTPAQFTYFYSAVYASYLGYADQLGFTTDKPLSEQPYKGGGTDNYTWHDHLVYTTQQKIGEVMPIYAAALAKGVTLDEESAANIENNINNLHSAAEKQGISVDELIAKNYGEGVTEADVRKCLEIQALSALFKNSFVVDKEYTDKELEEECARNMATYYTTECLNYSFIVKIDSNSKAEDIAKAKAEAKVHADKLLATKDEEEFLAYVESYLMDGEVAEEKISKALEDARQTLNYAKNGDMVKWAFEQDSNGTFLRQSNDTKNFYNEEKGIYTVCMILDPAHRDEYAMRSVRHILISVDSHDKKNGLPDAEAEAKADAILEELRGAGEEKFAEAAEKYSMDTGSAKDGGLFTDVGKGDMVAEFDEWLYNSSRSEGDMDIVKTKYGYHIMYYAGEGPIKWKYHAENILNDMAANAEYSKLLNEYAVSVNPPCLESIKSF